MQYKFPEITTINPIIRATADKPEFIVIDKGEYKVVDYIYQDSDTFTGPYAELLRECRGICFDKVGNLIRRPFHKFFNVNEKDETQAEEIDKLFNSSHILEKLDGSMVTPLPVEEENGKQWIRWATRKGITDVSMKAECFVAKNANYKEFAWNCIDMGLTPIFEWLDPKNPIVIQHKKENLVLLAIRHNFSGDYLPYERLELEHDLHNISIVQKYDVKDVTLGKLITLVRNAEDEEGVVIKTKDGHMAKLKGDWYLQLHRVKSALSSSKDKIALILDGGMDDLKATLPIEHKKEVQEFEDYFWKSYESTRVELDEWYKRWYAHSKTRKDYALAVQEFIPTLLRPALFMMYDGATSKGALDKVISKHLVSNTKFDQLNNCIGLANVA